MTAVSGLDISAFAEDSVGRGQVSLQWYLVAVEVGFNLWRGGVAVDD